MGGLQRSRRGSRQRQSDLVLQLVRERAQCLGYVGWVDILLSEGTASTLVSHLLRGRLELDGRKEFRVSHGSTFPSPRPGLPPPEKIVYTAMLVGPPSAAPGTLVATTTYRVLRSTEVDPYDRPIAPSEVSPFSAELPAGDLDSFMGTARKAAKLSFADAPTKSFDDVSALIDTLTPEAEMLALQPPISTAATSKRVEQEQRNIRLRAFLYAASRETDNDFHLIVGRDPAAKPSVYMTVEVSGLPPKSSKSFTKLNAARNAFKAFFSTQLPSATYDFYDPPIPVELEGALFFDMTHAHEGRPGPATLRARIPTIWEIHPLSRIAFEP